MLKNDGALLCSFISYLVELAWNCHIFRENRLAGVSFCCLAVNIGCIFYRSVLECGRNTANFLSRAGPQVAQTSPLSHIQILEERSFFSFQGRFVRKEHTADGFETDRRSANYVAMHQQSDG